MTPFGFNRKAAMITMKFMVGPWHPRPSTDGFVERVVEEVRSAVLLVPGRIDEE
jgi:hypothetical protein